MYLVRLLIVGETGVGKTSLLVRFNEDNFISDQKTTIGVDYKAKEVEIDEELVKLQACVFVFLFILLSMILI
jgi:GTPase SAR1 family protein